MNRVTYNPLEGVVNFNPCKDPICLPEADICNGCPFLNQKDTKCNYWGSKLELTPIVHEVSITVWEAGKRYAKDIPINVFYKCRNCLDRQIESPIDNEDITITNS